MRDESSGDFFWSHSFNISRSATRPANVQLTPSPSTTPINLIAKTLDPAGTPHQTLDTDGSGEPESHSGLSKAEKTGLGVGLGLGIGLACALLATGAIFLLRRRRQAAVDPAPSKVDFYRHPNSEGSDDFVAVQEATHVKA